MKEHIRSATDKIIAMILLVAMVAIATSGALGVYWMYKYGIYADYGDYARRTVMELHTADESKKISSAYYSAFLENCAADGGADLDACAPGSNGESVTALGDYRRNECNLHISISNGLGKTLYENYSSGDESLYTRVDGYTYYFTADDSASGEYVGNYKVYPVTVEISVPEELSWIAKDNLSSSFFWINTAVKLRFAVVPVIALAVIAAVVILTMLAVGAGERNSDGEVVPGFIDSFPFELILVLVAAMGVAIYTALRLTVVTNAGIVMFNAAVILVMILWALLTDMFLETVSVRIKTDTMADTMLLYRLFGKIRKASKPAGEATEKAGTAKRTKKNTFKKLTVVILAIEAAEVFVLCFFAWKFHLVENQYFVNYGAVWLASRIIGIPILLVLALNFGYLRDAGSMIADGNLDSEDLSSRISFVPLRSYGADLDRIKRDMAEALESEMKSEHFRNELISNISHDIRTPLTIISGNAELLAGKLENNEDKEICEYANTLIKQVSKLRDLTTDLMDISKLTTGNVKPNLEDMDFSMIMEQCVGEHYTALESHNLTPELEYGCDDYTILADGSMLCRVIDNLMVNVEKYAMPGTRVYMRVGRDENGFVTASIRNVCEKIIESKDPNELFERMKRDDASRHNEGSGLGLSIAKSLTELMHGRIAIAIDGDLYTVTLSFPGSVNR